MLIPLEEKISAFSLLFYIGAALFNFIAIQTIVDGVVVGLISLFIGYYGTKILAFIDHKIDEIKKTESLIVYITRNIKNTCSKLIVFLSKLKRKQNNGEEK